MIASFLSLTLAAVQAAAPAPVPAPLGPQSMPRQGCAAYLWSIADRKLVAVAGADPATLRIAPAGQVTTYARQSETGAGGFGFAGTTRYGGGDTVVTLQMAVSTRAELTDGGLVQEATMTIVRAGADAVVVPVAGMIGCAPQR